MGLVSQGDIDLVKASNVFDEAWYRREYPDVDINGMDAAEHYLWLGHRLMRDPGPSFSTKKYLELNPDVAIANINPLVHYEKFGRLEGRRIGIAQRISLLQSRSRLDEGTTRTAIFAMYTHDGKVNRKIEWYLSGLSEVADHIVVVADNDIEASSMATIRRFTPHVIAKRHGEYDFGSYKRGIQAADELGLLDGAEELILCNDSCFGPLDSFGPMFKKMETRDVDFWGVTANSWPKYHLQSYFIVFRHAAFKHKKFREFFSSVKAEKDVSAVVLKYETELTSGLENCSLKWEAFVSPSVPKSSHLNQNPVHNPVHLLKFGCPLVKVKACEKISSNDDGMPELLQEVRRRSSDVASIILEETSIQRYEQAPKVGFSLIMPVYNRASLVISAIDSVLAQSHQNYELIVVDDLSTDDTCAIIEERYARELAGGKLILHKLLKKGGVSAARNAGLRLARKPWIAYIDSDNTITPGFLTCFASAISINERRSTFCARWRLHSNGSVRGAPYERNRLERGNYIDLGVFVHSRELIEKYGSFDENLKRLVDWDLILRLTKDHEPVFIDKAVMVYWDDEQDQNRISVRESLDIATQRVRKKNGIKARVTTIIPTYNHQDFIVAAMASVLGQQGDFDHEIIVCSDGSTDRTPTLVAEFCKRHPGQVRNLSLSQNKGISETFRRCIAASTGDYIAILEGDDVWTDPQKINKQLDFLVEHTDCSMVFSKIKVKRLPNGKESFLPRQLEIKKNKVDGADFLADDSMNLIANFSSCMFRSAILKGAPSRLYEGRFNEIALAFYLEQHGKIGFMDDAMSVYHQHENGVWTGSSREQQLRSGIETREMVLDVAHPRYRDAIIKIIDERYRMPLAELCRQGA